MRDSIRLHPEHGVNPTILACFWCGEDKNELALLGASYRGEAPRHMILNYDPCDECRANMAKGISIIECTQSPQTPNQPPLFAEGRAYPTGRWWALREEAIERLITDEELKRKVLQMRTCLMDPATTKSIGLGEADVRDKTLAG